MTHHGRSRGRWFTFVAAVAALALGALAAVAIAQQGTDSQTETTTQTTPGTPTIPEGFNEEDCTFDEQPDGSTVVSCQREAAATETSSAELRAEEEAALEASATETDVVPVGGTGAGHGGTAADDGSAVPILIGIGGLMLALTAMVLMRRRRLE